MSISPEIRRLARSSNVGGETLVKRFFVNALPENIAKEIRAMSNIESFGMDEMLCRARALLIAEKMENFGATAFFEKNK